MLILQTLQFFLLCHVKKKEILKYEKIASYIVKIKDRKTMKRQYILIPKVEKSAKYLNP